MLKKETKEKSRPLRARQAKDKKPPVNRKLLLWLFGLTGVISLFFWWRGKVLRGNGLVPDIGSGEIRWVIEPTKQVTVNSNSNQVVDFLDQIKEITATVSGTYAVYVYHLSDKTAYGTNETEVMGGASILKIPVIISAITKIESGEMSFQDRYTLEEADRTAGSGPLQFKAAGTEYTIDELLNYLGKNSDNTAWVMFNRRLGKEIIQGTMDRLGMASSDYGQLTTTAGDVGKMWEYLYSGRMTENNRKKVWEYLTESIYEDRLPAGLAGMGAEILGHKVGTDVDVWADAGIVKCRIENAGCRAKPFVLVIMNEGVKRAEATGIVPEIAKRVWEFENGI